MTDELDRALQNIQLRLDSGATRVVVATGPAGGEYARFVSSVTARLDQKQAIEVAYTEGSVANAFLVDRGKARFALVQSDVAAAAVTGAGVFGAVGPLRHLRAVASLFPEPVHVVVRRDAGIETVAGLVGRRVSLGVPGSGTRHTALAVLRAHGLADGSYEDVTSVDPGDALAQLATGTLDAVITVASAPWDQLVQAGGTGALRVLPLDATAIDQRRVRSARPGAAADPGADVSGPAGTRADCRGDRAAGRQQQHARCRRRSGPRDAVRSGLERRPRGHGCAAVARAGAGRDHDSAA